MQTFEIDGYGNTFKVTRTPTGPITLSPNPKRISVLRGCRISPSTRMVLGGDTLTYITEFPLLCLSTTFQTMKSDDEEKVDSKGELLLVPKFEAPKSGDLSLTLLCKATTVNPDGAFVLLSTFSPTHYPTHTIIFRYTENGGASKYIIPPCSNVNQGTGKYCFPLNMGREGHTSIEKARSEGSFVVRGLLANGDLESHFVILSSLTGDFPNLWQSDLSPDESLKRRFFRWVVVPPDFNDPFIPLIDTKQGFHVAQVPVTLETLASCTPSIERITRVLNHNYL